jgi:H+/Cl- antiporter ClcA
MCGMSASFAALFRTPLAASVMPIEMSTVGVMYYSAFMPCVVAALTAHVVAGILNPGSEETMLITNVPEFSLKQGGLTILFAINCSLVAVLFCSVLHSSKKLAKLTFKNVYLRAAICGAILVVLTLMTGSQTYNGAGAAIIESCVLDGAFKIAPYAFLLKMLFTAVTLSGGFQGGEIVPTLFVGATFGHAFAMFFGMSPTMGAALGATFVFCGVTNCPMTSILIGFELFGYELSPFILLGVAITFLFSGNYGLYGSQKIRFSKYNPGRVDINAH